MTMSTLRRYSPCKSVALQPEVLAVLTDSWVNTASISKTLGRWSDDHMVRYALRTLTAAGLIDRMITRGQRGKPAFLYRRKT